MTFVFFGFSSLAYPNSLGTKCFVVVVVVVVVSCHRADGIQIFLIREGFKTTLTASFLYRLEILRFLLIFLFVPNRPLV